MINFNHELGDAIKAGTECLADLRQKGISESDLLDRCLTMRTRLKQEFADTWQVDLGEDWATVAQMPGPDEEISQLVDVLVELTDGKSPHEKACMMITVQRTIYDVFLGVEND